MTDGVSAHHAIGAAACCATRFQASRIAQKVKDQTIIEMYAGVSR
jgi:hypothetical protein